MDLWGTCNIQSLISGKWKDLRYMTKSTPFPPSKNFPSYQTCPKDVPGDYGIKVREMGWEL
jgi:hypothetical protein